MIDTNLSPECHGMTRKEVADKGKMELNW